MQFIIIHNDWVLIAVSKRPKKEKKMPNWKSETFNWLKGTNEEEEEEDSRKGIFSLSFTQIVGGIEQERGSQPLTLTHSEMILTWGWMREREKGGLNGVVAVWLNTFWNASRKSVSELEAKVIRTILANGSLMCFPLSFSCSLPLSPVYPATTHALLHLVQWIQVGISIEVREWEKETRYFSLKYTRSHQGHGERRRKRGRVRDGGLRNWILSGVLIVNGINSSSSSLPWAIIVSHPSPTQPPHLIVINWIIITPIMCGLASIFLFELHSLTHTRTHSVGGLFLWVCVAVRGNQTRVETFM